MEVSTKRADADLATELQKAKTQQKIRNEQLGIKVIERQKQIEVMEQEIVRRERELEAQIKRPAKAEKYRLETLGEATKNRLILEAEAEAESLRAKGEAEAFAINAKAQAEAEAMKKKADAWKTYGGECFAVRRNAPRTCICTPTCTTTHPPSHPQRLPWWTWCCRRCPRLRQRLLRRCALWTRLSWLPAPMATWGRQSSHRRSSTSWQGSQRQSRLSLAST
jgi:hypothetical protein